MDAITTWLQGASGPVVYAVVLALVFLEDSIFVGFVLPGETAVVLGGVLASQEVVDVWWLGAGVVVAAVAGDSVGYEVGRRLGPRILQVRIVRGRGQGIARAQDFLRRHGPVAVFLGRFVAFFRAVMPALSGIAAMPYRRFLVANAAGGLAWGVGYTALGYLAGSAYAAVEERVGRVILLVLLALVLAALVAWRVRRHLGRLRGGGSAAGGHEPDDEGGTVRDSRGGPPSP